METTILNSSNEDELMAGEKDGAKNEETRETSGESRRCNRERMCVVAMHRIGNKRIGNKRTGNKRIGNKRIKPDNSQKRVNAYCMATATTESVSSDNDRWTKQRGG